MADARNRFDEPEPAGNADSAPPGQPGLRQLEDKSGPDERSSFYKKSDQTAGRDDLAQSEQAGGGFRYTRTQDDAPASQLASKSNKSKPHKRGLSGWNRRRKLLTGLGGAGIIAAAVVAFFLSVLPFELIHIKHVVTDDIGGTQARTYRMGRTKLYSTMFFFDEKGNYAGNKVGGIRRLMMENRSTKKMVSALKKNGYEIHFDRQGRVTSLNRVDDNGKVVESYKSQDSLLRAWSIKDPEALPRILREIYPDKSDFWYNRATAQMNRRLGLTRTNWLREALAEKTGLNAANRKIGAVEERFVSALRQKLFGSIGDPAPAAGSINQDDPNNKGKQNSQAATDELNAKNSRFAKFTDAASSLKKTTVG